MKWKHLLIVVIAALALVVCPRSATAQWTPSAIEVVTVEGHAPHKDGVTTASTYGTQTSSDPPTGAAQANSYIETSMWTFACSTYRVRRYYTKSGSPPNLSVEVKLQPTWYLEALIEGMGGDNFSEFSVHMIPDDMFVDDPIVTVSEGDVLTPPWMFDVFYYTDDADPDLIKTAHAERSTSGYVSVWVQVQTRAEANAMGYASASAMGIVKFPPDE